MTMAELPDRRALAFPDTPYSGYCKVCWHAVYIFWSDAKDDHRGECMNGHKAAHECPEAQNRDRFSGEIAKLRAQGLLSGNCDKDMGKET